MPKKTTKKKPVSLHAKKPASKVAPKPTVASPKPLARLRQNLAIGRKSTQAAEVKPVTTARRLLLQTWQVIASHPKLFIGLFIAYVITTWLLVGTGAQGDYLSLKGSLGKAFGGDIGALSQSGPLFFSTISGAFGQTLTDVQQFSLNLVTILFWLVFIAATRHTIAEKKVRIRDVLYTAPAPLLPFVLILIFICLQLIPGALGAFLFTLASSGGFITNGLEMIIFIILAFIPIMLSLYWVVSSLIALVIVALPNMYPRAALVSAKQLVRGRRLTVLLRLLGLILWIVLLWIIVLLPFIVIDIWVNIGGIISILIQLLTQATLLLSAVYIYRLYRSLLK
ncbi:MAG TPA: hypothetical protein VH144_03170 [Candidatus Saccharimonadales bacterium]|jgi:hypothetical protein|nr:hypothetical protein [Candidatus Saccharimonadales bacterium]